MFCGISGVLGDAIKDPVDESGRLGCAEGTCKFDSFVYGDCYRNIFSEEDFIPSESEDSPVDPVESLRRIIIDSVGNSLIDGIEVRMEFPVIGLDRGFTSADFLFGPGHGFQFRNG